jgi:hypothetical protein
MLKISRNILDNVCGTEFAAEDGSSTLIGTEYLGGLLVQLKEEGFCQPSPGELVRDAVGEVI